MIHSRRDIISQLSNLTIMPKTKKPKVREIKKKIKVKEIKEEADETEEFDEDDEHMASIARSSSQTASPTLKTGDIEHEFERESIAPAAAPREETEERTSAVRYDTLLTRGTSDTATARYETSQSVPLLKSREIRTERERSPFMGRDVMENEMGREEKYELKKPESQKEKKQKYPWEA